MNKKRLTNWIVLTFLLAILAFFIYSYFTKGFFYSLINFNQGEMISFISSFKKVSFLVYILLIIAGIIFAPIHPFLFYVAGGIVFGPYVSWFLTMIGVAIGSSIAFIIARRYGRGFVEERIKKESIEKFDKFSDKYGVLSIFILRVNPLTSSDVWSYLAGLTKMKLWKFLTWTLLGLAPAIFIQTYLGKTIGENTILFKIFVAVAVIYFTILLLGFFYFLFLKKLKKKKKLPLN